jgi:hypothetical protein
MTILRPMATAALLALAGIAGATLREQVLDPTHLHRTEEATVLRAHTDALPVLAPPTVLYHVLAAPDGWQEGGVEITVDADRTAEIEMQGIYDGNIFFLMPRRTVPQGRSELRVEMPQPDRLTSFTLTLRAAEPTTVRLSAPVLRDFRPLSPINRTLAFREARLWPREAQFLGADGTMTFDLAVPEAAVIGLMRRPLHLDFRGDTGITGREAVTLTPLAATTDERTAHRRRFSVKPPAGFIAGAISLVATDDHNREREIARLRVDTTVAPARHYQVAGRSIEDFAAIERHGELALYAVAADEGFLPGPSGAPLFSEVVILAAGDGAKPAVEEPVLRTRRDNPYLYGGPSSFSVLADGKAVHGLFTAAAYGGGEAMHSLFGPDSLRLSPSAKNPVWPPQTEASFPRGLWRGNALFLFDRKLLLVALQQNDQGALRPRLLVAEAPWRWIDLGWLPLPDMPEGTTWLSSYTRGGEYYLLAGPTPAAWRTTDLLRNWQPIEWRFRVSGRKAQLLDWKGKTWLFHLDRLNGRGIIRWNEAVVDGSGISPATQGTAR